MNITTYVVEFLAIEKLHVSISPSIPLTQNVLVVAMKNHGVQYIIANVQQPTMILLALDTLQIDLALMGWQMAIYRSIVKAVKESAEALIPRLFKNT